MSRAAVKVVIASQLRSLRECNRDAARQVTAQGPIRYAWTARDKGLTWLTSAI